MKVFSRLTEREIREGIDILLAEIGTSMNPLIYLFGSYATKNSATGTSDVDVLVILDNDQPLSPISRPENLRGHWEILTVGWNTFLKGLQDGRGFYLEIASRGELLYGDLEKTTLLEQETRLVIKEKGLKRGKLGWGKA